MQESGACWEAIPNIWAGQIQAQLPPPSTAEPNPEVEVEFHPGAWENPRLRLPASLWPHGPCASQGPWRGWEVLATPGTWAARLHPRWRRRRIQ